MQGYHHDGGTSSERRNGGIDGMTSILYSGSINQSVFLSALVFGKSIAVRVDRLAGAYCNSNSREKDIHVGIKLVEMLTLLPELLLDGVESVSDTV